MNHFNIRKANISRYEIIEHNLDDYILCSECGEFVYEYCAIHGPLLIIPDDKVPPASYPSVPHSLLTIPHVFLHLAASTIPGAGTGVFTTLTLPRGVRFGPYRGSETNEVTSEYCWQIHDGKNKRSHYVDAGDANNSNWMRYVNCSRHWSEQNLVAYQYKGMLYYRTIKIIPKFTELMVYYGGEYANILRINLHKYNSPTGSIQQLGVTNFHYLEGSEDNPDEQLNSIPQYNLTNYSLTSFNEANQTDDGTKNTNEKSNSDIKTKNFCVAPKKSHEESSNNNYVKHTETTVNVNKNTQNEEYDVLKSINSNVIHKTSTKKAKNNNKKYICNICQYETNKEINLAFHLRLHETRKNVYNCTHCKYITDRKSTLRRHINTHMGEKLYECEICSRKYSRNFDFRRHVRKHTDERPS
ncbi:unnamed protein product [Euphydryas editha]|uniref:Histone-lysine N-methyltransferase PRDM9 n=1 Tax=Euphydryas editha TaxID=104508 RepID=A0AAU9URA1_EUPED|nr:unnamed protein product [Euphydryas editha]